MSRRYSRELRCEYKGSVQNFSIGFVSGALLSALKNSAKEGRSSQENIKSGFKTAIQSGIAAASIARANDRMIKDRDTDAVISLAFGAGLVYFIEKAWVEKNQKST